MLMRQAQRGVREMLPDLQRFRETVLQSTYRRADLIRPAFDKGLSCAVVPEVHQSRQVLERGVLLPLIGPLLLFSRKHTYALLALDVTDASYCARPAKARHNVEWVAHGLKLDSRFPPSGNLSQPIQS